MTEANDDNDSAADHITKYAYDQNGNIIEERVLIDEGNNISEKVILHQYDQLGREILIIYPTGLTVSNTYDPVGRVKKVSVVE